MFVSPSGAVAWYPKGVPPLTNRIVLFIYSARSLRPWAAVRPTRWRVFTAGVSGTAVRALTLGLASELPLNWASVVIKTTGEHQNDESNGPIAFRSQSATGFCSPFFRRRLYEIL